ncbi:hypothetical protein HanXRQr2_Chr04g0156061 [Helianthus annuus]|uniref:Uncharacterized protein n=1 Tax=Helianthus annuus TaxID=4232 RepID=A0A9K3NQY5_HELAN|nr:hypothetical protein HanXRQr2_Chr04g0156061 [Helianthus annuus]KAJ0930503.1 hypothetical protein HanPSC8_Chr04g0150071 [Helianthus annuus]
MIKIETSKRSRIHLLHIAMRSPKFRIKTIEPANNPTARNFQKALILSREITASAIANP